MPPPTLIRSKSLASTAPPTADPTGASPAALPQATGERILLFSVGDRVYGCPVEAVREIVPSRRTTRLPGAPAYVRGLMNLRGLILTIIDLGLRLGESAPAREDGSTVLIEHRQRLMGIAVDEVMDVQPLATDALEQPSAPGGAEKNAGIVRGLGHLGDGRVVILLDVHLVVGQVLR